MTARIFNLQRPPSHHASISRYPIKSNIFAPSATPAASQPPHLGQPPASPASPPSAQQSSGKAIPRPHQTNFHHPPSGQRLPPARCTLEIGFRVKTQTSIARISFCSSVAAIFPAASPSIRRKTRCKCAFPCFFQHSPATAPRNSPSAAANPPTLRAARAYTIRPHHQNQHLPTRAQIRQHRQRQISVTTRRRPPARISTSIK